jgi:hypothetical protein
VAGLNLLLVLHKVIHGEDLVAFSFHILYLLKSMVSSHVLTQKQGLVAEPSKGPTSVCWKNQRTKLLEYRSGEKSENLIVERASYGQFSIFIFVLKERSDVHNYVDNKHPVIMTLNGQNHGEMTSTMLVDANLPELASSIIVEIRLDNLDDEALSEIISNSRETPKNTFTRAQRKSCRVNKDDDALKRLKRTTRKG